MDGTVARKSNPSNNLYGVIYRHYARQATCANNWHGMIMPLFVAGVTNYSTASPDDYSPKDSTNRTYAYAY